MLNDQELINAAKKIHLRYLSDSLPGIKRTKSGKAFKYLDQNGVTIYNHNTLERINSLNIPPAWVEVWISPRDDSHLQATGLDQKGRKQYIYHSDWLELCRRDKFDKLVGFGQSLPVIRKNVLANLKERNLSRERVIAAVIWLLEHTFIRVGNDEYAKDNKSYGLTTLRGRHVDVWGENIKFEFIGKSGVPHLVHVSHPTIAKTIRQCIELPGYELFKCIDEDGQKHIIDSSDVNQFLKNITGEETTAKEFRTWGGTVLAAGFLDKLGPNQDKKIIENNIVTTVKEVSKHLRNTPKVCRQYYIHPAVIDSYTKGELTNHFKGNFARKNLLSAQEVRVLNLLQKYS
jgi:DNA topoisomerase I